uniref:Alanine dehydrogenase n=1 Tax=Loigolactobacillus rennini TaxID=238013 RepID=A0A1K2I4A7_9LACO|nr:Alanine dehydrogenase [Loigolactobacillus rennini]
MQIGIPKEIKNNENRVGITPSGVMNLIHAGQRVVVEKGAGIAAGYPDQDYIDAGAKVATADDAWHSDLVMKVKEPLAEEYHYFHPGLILYTYLHLAANPDLTKALLENKVTAIGYETMTAPDGSLPALIPMSQVAGRMSIITGSQYLQKQYGGKGELIASVPGVARCNVVIVGGGTVGYNAAKIAVGMGAQVTVLDVNPQTLTRIDNEFDEKVQTLFSNHHNLAKAIRDADLVIGAVLLPGAKAPKLISKKMVQSMEPGSVIIDIPIDQGGICETTTHATTFDDPVYVVEDVIHYAVANVPGAVPKTATDALTNITVKYASEIGKAGVKAAIQADSTISSGVNTINGQLVEKAVADSLDLPYKDLKASL